jgi:hypothetical protein
MRRAAPLLACLLLAVLPGAAQARHSHHAHGHGHGRAAATAVQPVVVELFTSQGCSACVSADKLLSQLADRPGVLALTFAVDYWDYLGWNDTFARPEFSARQKAYMERQSLRDLYTPQIIVDGKSQVAGAEPKKIDSLIAKAKRTRPPHPPRMRFMRRSRVQIGPGPRPEGGADVWMVRYDPALHQVTVKRGENRGQTLAQRNVVRELVRLGAWTGRRRSYAVPAPLPGDSGLRTGILLQGAKGGRILGVLQR